MLITNLDTICLHFMISYIEIRVKTVRFCNFSIFLCVISFVNYNVTKYLFLHLLDKISLPSLTWQNISSFTYFTKYLFLHLRDKMSLPSLTWQNVSSFTYFTKHLVLHLRDKISLPSLIQAKNNPHKPDEVQTRHKILVQTTWNHQLKHFIKTCRVISCATCFTVFSYLVYSSTPKKQAKCFSATSIGFQWNTRRYIPEARSLH
jgi:branched-subunit amino acid transport protein